MLQQLPIISLKAFEIGCHDRHTSSCAEGAGAAQVLDGVDEATIAGAGAAQKANVLLWFWTE
jgi:hypothetical protein